MSEHREYLLPDTEDMSCRGAAIVGLHAGWRQRIYRCQAKCGITSVARSSADCSASDLVMSPKHVSSAM